MTTLPWGPLDRSCLTPLDGGVTSVPGVRAAGIAAGLKESGAPDLALVDAGSVVGVSAVTTTNLVKAAPCVVTERHVADGRARAVVVNAGNANACTGPEGVEAAERTAAEVATALGCARSEVVPLSTGIIGVPLPVERILEAVPALVGDLGDDPDAGERAAQAITTTDTVTKNVAYEVSDGAGRCTVGGMAKGAGMIEPAMATLLAVLITDAPLDQTVHRRVLSKAIEGTFNRISVDACGSTNDTVVLLATGTAPSPPGLAALKTGIEAACADLAHAVVADGEGTSKVAAITVQSAATEAEAERLARAVTSSVLVRAALHGADPNWGRILAAMGASGVAFEPARVQMRIEGITVCRFGAAAAFDRGQVAAAMSRPELSVEMELGQGRRSATVLTADLTPTYVAENAYYTT